jgi:hypothetical protein
VPSSRPRPASRVLPSDTPVSQVLVSGHFSLDDISPLLSETTVKLVLGHAGKRFHDSHVEAADMKKVLGALSVDRSTASYDELLPVLNDETVPEDLRQQAVVSPLHGAEEAHAPSYVLGSVANLATIPPPCSSVPCLTAARRHLNALQKERENE